jgi:titin
MTGYRLFLDENGDGVAEKEAFPGVGDPTNPIDPGLNPTVLQFDETGTTTGQDYGFKLRAYNARGYSESTWSYIKSAAEPATMSAPGQNIVAGSSTSIVLTWSVPDKQGADIVGFKVFRDAGAGTNFLAAADPTCGMETNPAPQTCKLTGLTPGDMYQIRMLAVNDVGDGPLSPVVAFKSATVPAKINTLINTEASFAPMLAYSWTAPADQGASVYGYQAEVLRIETGIATLWDSGGTPADPKIPLLVKFEGDDANAVGLVRQRQYKFHVAAVNSQGRGEWSEWASLTDPPRGFCLNAPNTPLNFKRHTDTPVAGKIKFQWDAIGDENAAGGDDIAAITYEVWAGAVTPSLRAEIALNYYEQAVPAGQTWKFYVRALNSGGQRSVATATLSMVSAELPGQPPSLTLQSTTAAQVVLTWTVPSNGGTPIQAYEVTSNDFATSVETLGTDTTYTFLAQNAGATVVYKVRARNRVGVGPAQEDTIVVAR